MIQAQNCWISIVWIKKTSHLSAFCLFARKIMFMFKNSSWKSLIPQNRRKCHFWLPWPQNARECFAPLCLNTTRPAKTNLKTPARQPDPNSLQSPNGMAGAHETHFLQETLNCYFFTFLSCCENENLEISCSYWWGVTLRVIGWSMSLGRRRTATGKRKVSSLPL